MTIATYTKTGTASSTKTSLPKSLGLPSTNDLLHQTYSSQTANSRIRTAHTKKRGEVRGGGRKPWVQKGTGRARAGSIRSPIWRGGGVVFGPQEQRNYGRKINKSSARLALAQALKLAEAESRIKVIDDIKADGKTKSVKALLDKIQFSSGLIIDAELTAELKRALANLPGVRGVSAGNLSAQMVLEAREMLFTKDGLGNVIQRLEAKS